jgi:hypothetical protein
VIHLAQAEPGDAVKSGGIYLHVDDAGQLAAQWRAAGVEVTVRRTSTTASGKGHTLIRTATSSASDPRSATDTGAGSFPLPSGS